MQPQILRLKFFLTFLTFGFMGIFESSKKSLIWASLGSQGGRPNTHRKKQQIFSYLAQGTRFETGITR